MQLQTHNKTTRRKPKYHFTVEMDAEIRRVYRTMTGNGEVNMLAVRLGLPRWLISRRARDIEAYEPRIKEPNWSEKEIEILERSAHRHPEVIRRHLKKKGFIRSATGIILKRKRLRLPKNLEGQSATQLAICFGIDNNVVTRWIKEGLLKAQKRGTERTEQQGGDIYYIKDVWIKDFVKENIGIIDIRKLDKFWFVDVMAAN